MGNNDVKWFEQYNRISSSRFTIENSSRKLRIPYLHLFKDGKLIPSPYMKSFAEKYKIVGYTLNAPLAADFPYVAILFEHSETFELVWYHFNMYYD